MKVWADKRVRTLRGSTKGRRLGVTLVDLLITVTVMSIVVGIGVPSMLPALQDYQLVAAGQEVRAAVDYARSRAAVAGCETQVVFNVALDTVSVEERRLNFALDQDKSTQLSATIAEATAFELLKDPLNPEEKYVLELGGSGWTGGVFLVSADFGGRPELMFDERGVPTNDGTIVIGLDDQRLILQFDDSSGVFAR